MLDRNLNYLVCLDAPTYGQVLSSISKKTAMNRLKSIVIHTVFFLWFAGVLSSCNKDDGSPSGEGVGIRIENLSNYTFDEVLIEAGGGGEQEYLGVAPGAVTDYKDFDYTYRYAFIRTIVGTDTLTLQPVDYFGEQKFTEGRFTFRIDIVGESSPLYLVFEFKED